MPRLCSDHGWPHAPCAPPSCVRMSVRDAGRPRLRSFAVADVVLQRARQAARRGNLTGVVRARSFVSDGFWARAHFVMTQGIWASLRGARFVADLHPHADCETVRATATTAPCDVYADADSDPWEAYFEPIYGLRAADIRGGNQTTELDCAAALAQHLPDTNGVYPRTMAQAASYRARNAALVSEWVRIRHAVYHEAELEWRRLVRARIGGRAPTPAVLGVHLRGTDKFITPKVGPERYLPLIDAFVRNHEQGPRTALIYLATDDRAYQQAVVKRYGERRVMQLMDGGVARAAGDAAIWKSGGGGAGRRLGVQVLLETILLSRCDHLLKASSSVSEFAVYLKMGRDGGVDAADFAYDFGIRDQALPPWAT